MAELRRTPALTGERRDIEHPPGRCPSCSAQPEACLFVEVTEEGTIAYQCGDCGSVFGAEG